MKCFWPCILVSGFCACAAETGDPEVYEWNAMGTVMRLLVRCGETDGAGLRMRDAAVAAVESVEAETSVFRASSVAARVSAAAGTGEWIETGRWFDAALALSLEVAEKTGGAFNPLVAPLMQARGFSRSPDGAGSVGARSGEDGLSREKFDTSAIRRKPGACMLANSGMALDFGGVAKGLGADVAAAAIRAVATNDFLIDAGGNLVGKGEWTVGVRDPRTSRNAPPLRVLTLRDGMALASSGNYERFVETGDGAKIGHIFDPRTGKSPDGGVLQTTVLAPSAALADVWSTALFVLGPGDGSLAIAREPDKSALWVIEGADGAISLRASGAAAIRENRDLPAEDRAEVSPLLQSLRK